MPDFNAAVEAAERAQVIADLKAARAELVTRGRCVGALVDEDDGRVCALGAIGAATLGEDFVRKPYYGHMCMFPRASRAENALQSHLPHFDEDVAGSGVPGFNDNPATTDQDVLDLFDKTLADLGGLA